MFISLFQTFSVLKLLLPYFAGYYSRSHEKKSMQIKHLCGYAQMYFLETAFSPHTRSYSFLFPSFFYGLYTALSFYLCYNFVKSNCIKKESARAGMRKMIKRLLKKYKYPPDGMEDAIRTVIKQCEMWVEVEFNPSDVAESASKRMMAYQSMLNNWYIKAVFGLSIQRPHCLVFFIKICFIPIPAN